jgi:hypothetical protein
MFTLSSPLAGRRPWLRRLAAAALVGLAGSAQAGAIVVNHDVETLATASPGVAAFSQNLVRFLDRDGTQGGRILVFNRSLSLGNASDPAATLFGSAVASLGYTLVDANPGGRLTLDMLEAFDALLVAGPLLDTNRQDAKDDAVLQQYLAGGGGIYIAGGFGGLPFPRGGEAVYWNSFLDDYGIAFEPQNNNRFGLQPPGQGPLFDGVGALNAQNGRDLRLTGQGQFAPDRARIEQFAPGSAELGLTASWTSPPPVNAVPEPASLLLAGLGVMLLMGLGRLRRTGMEAACATATLVALPAQALITAGDPSYNEIDPASASGVGLLFEQRPNGTLRGRCSATLLEGGRHVLTAGHCADDNTREVRFDTPGGPVRIPIVAVHRHPNGYEEGSGADIAVLTLANVAQSNIQRHALYRGMDEVGQVFSKVAYGAVGTGATGQTGIDFVKREGSNRFDATLADYAAHPGLTQIGASYLDFARGPLAFVPQDYLLFDFDDGSTARDAFGVHFTGLADLGTGIDEINTGFGDSGSPAFISGRIAGLTSFGFSDLGVFASGRLADGVILEATSLDEVQQLLHPVLYTTYLDYFQSIGMVDLLGAFNNILSTDSSFGEFSAELRVSSYADWIDGIVAMPVPEPGAGVLLGLGLATLVWRRRHAGIADEGGCGGEGRGRRGRGSRA